MIRYRRSTSTADPAPAARASGRRVYGPDTVRTLAIIETGQRAGLTLHEIRDLLAATRCECPSLADCPLFDDPARLPQVLSPLMARQ